MDDHIRKLDTKIQSKESELNALFTKIQKLEEEIATLYRKKLISKKLESAEMTSKNWKKRLRHYTTRN